MLARGEGSSRRRSGISVGLVDASDHGIVADKNRRSHLWIGDDQRQSFDHANLNFVKKSEAPLPRAR